MTLTELRFFVTLAKTQHFGRAASLCHVSQSTLSMGIKRLEASLGLRLFERAQQGVMLTAAALPLLGRAQEALNQIQALSDLAAQGADAWDTPLPLGVELGLGAHWLPQTLSQLDFAAPQMPLVLEEGEASSLVDRLRSGALDVVFSCQRLKAPDVVCQTLVEEPYVLLLAESHPQAQGARLEPEALEPVWVSQWDRPLLAALAEQPSQRWQDKPISRELLLPLVAAGLACTWVPQSHALESCGDRRLTWRTWPLPLARPLCLSWRQEFTRGRALDALRQALLVSCSVFWPFAQDAEAPEIPRRVDNRRW